MSIHTINFQLVELQTLVNILGSGHMNKGVAHEGDEDGPYDFCTECGTVEYSGHNPDCKIGLMVKDLAERLHQAEGYCVATTRRGSPCTRKAQNGSFVCELHDGPSHNEG